MLPGHEQERFDALLEEAIGALPSRVRALLDEVPVIVMDRPDAAMLKDLGLPPDDEDEASSLCGLHTGTSNTERSVESAEMPSQIHLFREGIINLAGGWDQDEADDLVYEEIMVTLLHEIGHQFGLDEEDLERLGYD